MKSHERWRNTRSKIKYSWLMEAKTYHNHRQEPYFTFLKNGQKTIKGRARKEWYTLVKPGDYIVVHNEEETDSIKTLVKRISSYSSIREMLENEPLKKMLPDIQDVEQGVKIYRKFYTPEQEEKYGMVAIEVEVVES